MHVLMIIIITSIIIIRHDLRLDRLVPASSYSLLKGPPSHHRPFFYNAALFLTSCCSFLLYVEASWLLLFSFAANGFTFNTYKICSFLLWSRRVCQAFLLKHFMLTDENVSFSFFLRVQISLAYKRMGRASVLYTFILENFWTEAGIKVLCIVPSTWTHLLVFVECLFHFHGLELITFIQKYSVLSCAFLITC